MRAVDLNSGGQLARRLAVAETLLSRMKGLLGREPLLPGEGLWIRPCSAIHTIGMRFPIDALFLDRGKRVVGIAKSLRPNRISRWHFRAVSVIELPAGTIDAAQSRIGNEVAIDG